MSSKYTLTYFKGRGKAEAIRLLFAAAGCPFNDVRIEVNEVAAMKHKLPFGQLPLLEFDGMKWSQSLAIGRYLANEFGFSGKTPIEKLRADMIVDCIVDARQPVVVFFNLTDSVKKEELKQKYIKEELPILLDRLEALLIENKGGDSYYVGDSLTWADLWLVVLRDALELTVGVPTPLAKHAKLEALCQRVVDVPKIAEYISKRPVTTA